MSSRKKSTSSEDTSSAGSSDSTSSSSSSDSDSGSSSSDSDSSSSRGKRSSSPRNEQQPAATNSNTKTVAVTDKSARRRSSDAKQLSKNEEKPSALTAAAVFSAKSKTSTTSNRGQRLSKSSIYSSDDDEALPPPAKKLPLKTPVASTISVERKKLPIEPKRPLSTPHPPVPPVIGGGKAPPAIVKQHQQQNMAKSVASRQAAAAKQPSKRPQQQLKPQDKSTKKSIFSPENSSDSDVKNVVVEKKINTTKMMASKVSKQPVKTPSSHLKSRSAVPSKKPAVVPSKKKEERRSSGGSSGSGDSSSSDGSSSSSDSDESDSSDDDGDSSPPRSKKPPLKKIATKVQTKASSDSKTVILSDSDGVENKSQAAVRKLTRSTASTRKSKHLIGKPSDSDSDGGETDKRSISTSPVKKAAIISTKSKAKAKREVKTTIPLPLATPPVPEEQRCPVEGCDSSGHLSGNLEKHFLPEACPVYHNMSASETRERASERRIRDEERKKLVVPFDPARKFLSPEQRAYQMKIRESRMKFKPVPSSNEKKDKHAIIVDSEREPNLNGLVPEYDLQLFREAQAIASEKMQKEIKDLPVGKGTKYITMGKYQMKVWYQSPYPEDAARLPKMFLCEFCLRYQKSEVGIKRHAAKCIWRHPPGDEIYRKGKLQVWQVDGKRHKQYCQHLCLLAKFFLDHKTLYNDVEPFLFYVMTLADSEGSHTVGYFSKEKNSFLNYNVSCILTLPPYQRKGYGRLLIDFSYLLTRFEGKIGSPEKPLSDLGLISYRSYWKDVLLDYLCTRTGNTLSIKDVSQEMAIYSYDIVSTLQALGMMKYWKGKHIVLKKQDVLEEFEERVKRRGNFPKIDPACLRWTPFVPPQPSGSS